MGPLRSACAKTVEKYAIASNDWDPRSVEHPSVRKSQCNFKRVSWPRSSSFTAGFSRTARSLVSVVAWTCVATGGAVRPAAAFWPPPVFSPAAPVFTPPRLTRFVPATVPPAAFDGRSQVEVILTIDIDESGAVTSVQLVRSAGGENGAALDRAAIEAARQFAFAPGLADGRPVPVRITYSYNLVSKAPAAPPAPIAVSPPAPPPAPAANAQPADRFASTVRGRRFTRETVEQTLVAEEIQRIPGTQGDALKAVQNLPGVSRAPFGIGLLAVWGSAPEDTRVYVDGVSVPVLYHFGGVRSTVNSEMVQSLTFVPGAYQADHGLGLGGVVEVATRSPRPERTRGYAQIDLLDGSAMIEGRLSSSLSYAIAGRRSWIDATLPLFTSSSLQLSPVYYDYQARLAWRAGPHDDVDVLFLGSDDRVNIQARIKDAAIEAAVASHSYFHRAIASWAHRFGGRATLSVTGAVGYDAPFGLGVQFGQVPTSLDQHALSYALRAVATAPLLGDALRVNGGVDFEGRRFVLTRSGATSLVIDPASAAGNAGMGASGGFEGQGSGFGTDHLIVYRNDVAPFFMLAISPWRPLTITPQLRCQILTSTADSATGAGSDATSVSPEPRLAVRYRPSARLALRGAAGLYSQAPDPAALSPVFGNPRLIPERGRQYALGAEVELTRSLHVEIDGFYKDLRRLVVPSAVAGAPLLNNDGRGRAFGAQLLVRQELTSGFFGWVSYTWSRSEREDHLGEGWHRFDFDQTHILALILSRQLPRGFQVGGRYRYVTGTPTTPVVGAFYDAVTDRYVPVSGPRFGARLPSFNQLDLRVDKTFTFNRWRLSAYLDVQNVTRAENPEAVRYNFDYRRTHPISGLPLLPVLGIRGDF